MSVSLNTSEQRIELPVLECKRCGHKWTPRSSFLPHNCANPKCNSPYWNKERRVINDKFVLDPNEKFTDDDICDANEEILGFLHDRLISHHQTHRTPYINIKTLHRRLTENNPDIRHSTLIKYNIERLIVYHAVRLITRNGVRSVCFRDPASSSIAITNTEIRVFRDRVLKFIKKEMKTGNRLITVEDIMGGVDVREIGGIKIDKSRRVYCINTVLKIMVFDGELSSSGDAGFIRLAASS